LRCLIVAQNCKIQQKQLQKIHFFFLLMHAQELHDFVSLPQNESEWNNLQLAASNNIYFFYFSFICSDFSASVLKISAHWLSCYHTLYKPACFLCMCSTMPSRRLKTKLHSIHLCCRFEPSSIISFGQCRYALSTGSFRSLHSIVTFLSIIYAFNFEFPFLRLQDSVCIRPKQAL
jgi:hypothetical protein